MSQESSPRPSSIDDSPAGSWRAEIAWREGQPVTCAACRQSVCQHSDLEYQGLVPPRQPVNPSTSRSQQ